MAQEGRGIGLLNKLKAYELQETGPRHGRREPRARLRRRRARVGDRQPDPRRPRAHDDPPAHEQPEEGVRAPGVRARGRPSRCRSRCRRNPRTAGIWPPSGISSATACTTRGSSSMRRTSERARAITGRASERHEAGAPTSRSSPTRRTTGERAGGRGGRGGVRRGRRRGAGRRSSRLAGHAPGELAIPDGVDLLEGAPHGDAQRIAVVVVAVQRRRDEPAARVRARRARRAPASTAST